MAPESVCKFDHWLVWIIPSGVALARIIASNDLVGREGAFIAAAELQGCPLNVALRKLAPELERFIQRVVKLPTPDVVRAAFASQQGMLESMIAAEISTPQDLVLTSDERSTFLGQGDLDAEGVAVSRLLYKTESSWSPFAPQRGGKAPKTSGSGAALRLPASPGQVAASVMLWEEFALAKIHPEVPRLYILPAAHNWLDMVVGELKAGNFENLLKNRSALAPETTVNHPATPELKTKAGEIMLGWGSGNFPSLVESPKQEPPARTGGTMFISKPNATSPSTAPPALAAAAAEAATSKNPKPQSSGNGMLIGVVVATVVVIFALAAFLMHGSKTVSVADEKQSATTEKPAVTAPAPTPAKLPSSVVKTNAPAKPAAAVVPTVAPAPAPAVVVAPSASVFVDATICFGASATIKADLRGTAPWKATWSDGASQTVSSPLLQRTVSPTATTTYTLTSLSDANASSGSGDLKGSATVTVNPELKVNMPSTLATGEAGVAQLNAAVSGGSPQYTYKWTPAEGLDSPSAAKPVAKLDEGTSAKYNVTVTDALGCTASGSVTVQAKAAAPPAAVVSGGGSICPGDKAEIKVLLEGKKPWTLEWVDGERETVLTSPHTRIVSPAATTDFALRSVSDSRTVIATEIKGGAKVVVYKRPSVTLSGSGIINKGESATLKVSLTGEGPWELAWSDGVRETVSSASWSRSVSPAEATVYRITGLRDSHCSAGQGDLNGSAQITVQVPKPVAPVAVQPAPAPALAPAPAVAAPKPSPAAQPVAVAARPAASDPARQLDQRLKQLMTAFNLKSSIQTPSVRDAVEAGPTAMGPTIDEAAYTVIIEGLEKGYASANLLDSKHKADISKLRKAVINWNNQ